MVKSEPRNWPTLAISLRGAERPQERLGDCRRGSGQEKGLVRPLRGSQGLVRAIPIADATIRPLRLSEQLSGPFPACAPIGRFDCQKRALERGSKHSAEAKMQFW
uniref:Uncharacterized protein n=1 Tax=Paracoccus aestuarii TaxID=453842 RepID=H9BRS5_9RHOB|nr:hypothetical protein [Paracoccus aestuarii]